MMTTCDRCGMEKDLELCTQSERHTYQSAQLFVQTLLFTF